MNPLDLLERYRPVLQYDSQELYAATAVEAFVGSPFGSGPSSPYGTTLRRTDRTEISSTTQSPPLTLAWLGTRAYPNGATVNEGDFLDPFNLAYAADARDGYQRYGDKIYARFVPARNDGRHWLQYWFFYYYNSKQFAGLGVHEGDWEMVQFGIAQDAKAPDVATYSQHRDGEPLEWSDLEIDLDTGAPLVFVALGSHASYAKDGDHDAPIVDDRCDAGGKRVRPSINIIDTSAPSWVNWPGRWGSSPKKEPISFDSPVSPACQGNKWTDPDKFHKSAEKYRHKWHMRLFGIAPLDFTPTVNVVRQPDGSGRQLTYDIPPLPQEAWTAQLIITVNSVQGKPPHQYVYDATALGADLDPLMGHEIPFPPAAATPLKGLSAG